MEELVSRSEQEKYIWREIVESGKRYEGAESKFKELRSDNSKYLFRIVNEIGWPEISKYGEEVNEAAYCIARAAIAHPKEMKYFLGKISESVESGESNPAHLAALEDCIRYYEGRSQICGLFLEWKVSGELYANVESMDIANATRKKLGLPSVQEAIKAHLEELNSNPGSKPKDIQSHNEMHRNWAKRAGWLCA